MIGLLCFVLAILASRATDVSYWAQNRLRSGGRSCLLSGKAEIQWPRCQVGSTISWFTLELNCDIHRELGGPIRRIRAFKVNLDNPTAVWVACCRYLVAPAQGASLSVVAK